MDIILRNEKEATKLFRQTLKLQGYDSVLVKSEAGYGGTPGMPDVLVLADKILVPVEMKFDRRKAAPEYTGTSYLRPQQRTMLRLLGKRRIKSFMVVYRAKEEAPANKLWLLYEYGGEWIKRYDSCTVDNCCGLIVDDTRNK